MKKFIIAALLLGFVAACGTAIYLPEIPKDTQYLKMDGPAPPNWVSFSQGWDDDKRSSFWFTPQGAHVMPYRWFAALEQPNNEKLFRNSDHMGGLGYLPMEQSESNPAGLPIGFAMSRATTQQESFVGFTCAACHTNQIDFDGKSFLIDGAPTLANFVGFFDATVESLNNTYSDTKKFQRFAKRVLGEGYTVTSAGDLKERLFEVAKGSTERQKVNSIPDHYPRDFTSYGRLDAFTNIENAGTAFGLGMLSNRNPAIAPVSYPFLWGTHQSNVVQWNGSAPNEPRIVGPMVRNMGQVVGVFGGLTINKASWWQRILGKKAVYSSTVDFEGLGELEGLVKGLQAPAWNDPASNLPALDIDRVAAGAILYDTHCSSCHTVVKPENQLDNYTAVMTPVSVLNTDPMTAWAAEHNRASTGLLKGSKAKIVAGDRFRDSTQSINISVNGVVGIALKHPRKLINGILITKDVKSSAGWRKSLDEYALNRDSILEDKVEDHDLDGMVMTTLGTSRNLKGLKYKARPLNGIWATAPYLHNGSVPNLWQLLLPSDKRMTSFWVGSYKFDAKHVGFVTDQGKNEFKVMDRNDKVQEGNSNFGHLWGTMLSEEERWSLVEYMKSL
jgi:mono/diheme cytochrome c family protein